MKFIILLDNIELKKKHRALNITTLYFPARTGSSLC